jgi:hypothetical protein
LLCCWSITSENLVASCKRPGKNKLSNWMLNDA